MFCVYNGLGQLVNGGIAVVAAKDLSPRQRQILSLIRKQIQERGYPPSVRELGEAVGLRSSSTVHAHLTRLEERGYIRRDPTKPRAIEIVHPDYLPGTVPDDTIQLPLVGQVTAGEPILAVENIEEYLTFPRSLVGNGGEGTFVLRVKGDSMIEAGIFDGDFVIVKRGETAENGEIVVALIEDEATIKRFYKEESRIRLQPANRSMEPIYVQDVRIIGKVIGLYRKLN